MIINYFYSFQWIFEFCYYDLGSRVAPLLTYPDSFLNSTTVLHLTDTMQPLRKLVSLQYIWKDFASTCWELYSSCPADFLTGLLLYFLKSSLNKKKHIQAQCWKIRMHQLPSATTQSAWVLEESLAAKRLLVPFLKCKHNWIFQASEAHPSSGKSWLGLRFTRQQDRSSSKVCV